MLKQVFVAFLLAAVPAYAAPPKRLLLFAQGPDGHPPQTHEYVLGLEILQKSLAKVPDLDITLARADEPWRDGPALLAKADGAVVFLSEGAKWLQNNPERLKAFQELAQRKGGLAVLHWGMGTKDAKNIDAFVQLFGGCHGGPDRKYKVLSTQATIADPKHPVTLGLKDFKPRDEFYYQLKFPKTGPAITPLLKVDIDGSAETVAWAYERPDGGRSFGFSGLHFHENWHLAEYRRLVTQGVLWTMRLP
jgi:type 1 glutamine amidotransferase